MPPGRAAILPERGQLEPAAKCRWIPGPAARVMTRRHVPARRASSPVLRKPWAGGGAMAISRVQARSRAGRAASRIPVRTIPSPVVRAGFRINKAAKANPVAPPARPAMAGRRPGLVEGVLRGSPRVQDRRRTFNAARWIKAPGWPACRGLGHPTRAALPPVEMASPEDRPSPRVGPDPVPTPAVMSNSTPGADAPVVMAAWPWRAAATSSPTRGRCRARWMF